MTITVVGLGLIGGSMALSLKENNFADTIIGVDNNAQHTAKALSFKLKAIEPPIKPKPTTVIVIFLVMSYEV